MPDAERGGGAAERRLAPRRHAPPRAGRVARPDWREPRRRRFPARGAVRAARLEAAITALPPPFRETLVLRDIQGLDYREIAAVTEVPIGTVMSRLARARSRLIETIGRDEP